MSVNVESDFEKLFPGGVNSPVRAFTGLEIPPLIVAKGRGDTIWDREGRAFIDFCGSFGPLILGHAHPRIVAAIGEQCALGTTFGATTELERSLGQKICNHMPSIEKLRFVSSGTEAAMSALRLSRGFTGRSPFLKFTGCYHGHADPFLIKAGSGLSSLSSSAGVPKEVVAQSATLPFNDAKGARSFLRSHEVACVIVEPIAGNMGLIPATEEFLHTLRKETERQGAVLIFDEVITGFRVGLGGAQALYGIRPDLTCLGKIIGGGLPAAAFGGKGEIMNLLAPLGPVYQAGTLSGNPLAMRAGLETLTLLEGEGVYEELEAKTRLLTEPLSEAIRSRTLSATLHRVGSCFTLFLGPTQVRSMDDLKALDQDRFRRFYRALYREGIYLPPSPYETSFVSLSHTEEHLRRAAAVMIDALCRL